MNDTNLQAYALSKGIEKNTQEMTSQEKIGLAMQMFLEKTADYAGNYAKENETLAGSLTTAKAALKNFLSGAGDAETLADALVRSGKVISTKLLELLPNLVQGISTLLTELVPQIPPLLRKLLPGVIEGTISLVKGIVEAADSLISELIKLVPDIVKGIVSIVNAIIPKLPDIIRKVVPTLINAVAEIMAEIAKAIVDALPEIMDAIGGLISGLSDSVLLVGALFVAFKSFSIVTTVVKWIKNATTAFKALNTAMKSSSGIIGIVIVAVEALVGLFLWLANNTEECLEPTYKLTEAEQEVRDAAMEAREEHEKLKEAFNDAAEAADAEYDYVNDLWHELQTLADESGNVDKANRERAEYILSKLSEATGEEWIMLDGTIQRYKDMQAEIENTLKAKQAERLLTEHDDLFTQAKEDRDEAKSDMMTRQEELNVQRGTLNKATISLGNFYAEHQEELSGFMSRDGIDLADFYQVYPALALQLEQLQEDVKENVELVNELEGEYQEAKKAYFGYELTVQEHEQAEMAFLQGDYDTTISILDAETTHRWEMLYERQAISEEDRRLIEDDLDSATRYLALLQDELEKGNGAVTEEMISEAQKTVETLTSILNGTYEAAKEAGANMIDGFQKGIEEREPWMVTAAGSAAYKALDAMKTTAEIRSPSRVTRGFGRYIMEGLALGIEDEADQAIKAAEEATSNALDAMTAEASSISMGFDPSNVPSVDHVISGAVDTKQDLRSLIESLPDLITYAISNGLSLNINNREFARMVKAVT